MIGVYLIENKVNLKKYIGSSSNIEERVYRHKRMLINNNHFNKHLQSSWNRYGENNFLFSILEENVLEENLLERESFWFESYDIFEENKGYNILSIAKRHKGRRLRLTDKHKKNISEGLNKFYNNNDSPKKGKKYPEINIIQSKETKNKISLSLRKFYENNDNPMKGKKHTKESRLKMSNSQKKYFSENDNPMKGKKHTKESRLKMSNSHKGYKQSEEQKKKLSERVSGKNHPLYGKKGKENPKYISLTEENINIIIDLYCMKKYSITKIVDETGIKRPIITRELKLNGVEIKKINQFTI